MPKSFPAAYLKCGFVDPADLKEGHSILWPYRGEVEMGDVILADAERRVVTVAWLDGYRSRTDDVPFDDVIGAYSAEGRQVQLGHISGKTLFTATGQAKFAAIA